MRRAIEQYDPYPTQTTALPGFDPASEPPRESPWKLLNDRLCGRWRFMLIVGGALSLVMAIIGYTSTSIKYESTGWIRIKPTKSVIVSRGPEHETYNFRTFVTTHEQFIQSRRVLQRTLADKKVSAFKWAKKDNAILVLEKNLEVVSDRDSELIHVTFKAATGEEAQTVVNTIIKSYEELYAVEDGEELNVKIQRLHDNKQQLERELFAIQENRRRILSQYDSGDLHGLQQLMLRDIRRIQDQINLAQAKLDHHDLENSTGGQVLKEVPTPEALASMDAQLADALAVVNRAKVDFEVAQTKYKSTSYAYRRTENWVRDAQQRFDALYNITLKRWQNNGGMLANGDIDKQPLLSLPPAMLRRQMKVFNNKLTRQVEESQKLTVDLDKLSSIGLDERRLQSDLDVVLHRIRYLGTEEQSLRSGFISIAQMGYLPPEPNRDSRRKRAAFGLVFGFGLSFAAFFFVGAIDRRAYGATQLEAIPGTGGPPCLGVLPDLGESLADPGSSEVAAHCVHQIRNQIEALRQPGKGYALAITSPFQGDGKTSIVMALGWSYAVAGFKTVMIDCDMVGRSLTRQLGLVGEKGLREVLLSGTMNGETTRLPMTNLHSLPVGVDSRFGAESLRKADLEDLFNRLREEFDIILVDTGPMLGSLESTPVVAAADGVMLSVRRGRARSRLDDCINRLNVVGAHCVGLVLNCAVRSDCKRYVSEASLSTANHPRELPATSSSKAITVVKAVDGNGNAVMRAMESASQVHRSKC